MKFFGIFSAASLALGAPLVSERQSTTPLDAVTSSLSVLQADVTTNQNAISSAVANAEGNAGAAASVAASVNANLEAIAQGFAAAASSIAAALGTSAQAIAATATALSASELAGLQADLNTLANVVAGLSATINVEFTNLEPNAQAAINTEVGVVEAAIAPVVNPIMIFANAASKASASAGATVNGVAGAYGGVDAVVEQFDQTNGLPGIAFPGFNPNTAAGATTPSH